MFRDSPQRDRRRLQPAAVKIPVHIRDDNQTLGRPSWTAESRSRPHGPGSLRNQSTPSSLERRVVYDQSARSYIGRFQSAIDLATHLILESLGKGGEVVFKSNNDISDDAYIGEYAELLSVYGDHPEPSEKLIKCDRYAQESTVSGRYADSTYRNLVGNMYLKNL